MKNMKKKLIKEIGFFLFPKSFFSFFLIIIVIRLEFEDF